MFLMLKRFQFVRDILAKQKTHNYTTLSAFLYVYRTSMDIICEHTARKALDMRYRKDADNRKTAAKAATFVCTGCLCVCTNGTNVFR